MRIKLLHDDIARGAVIDNLLLANNSLAHGLNYKTNMFYFRKAWFQPGFVLLHFHTEVTKTKCSHVNQPQNRKNSNCAKTWKIGKMTIWDIFIVSFSMSVIMISYPTAVMRFFEWNHPPQITILIKSSKNFVLHIFYDENSAMWSHPTQEDLVWEK